MSEAVPRLGLIETEGAGPPLVLLHGFGGSAASWNAVLPVLDRAALAFDLPGHAGSLGYPGFGSASFAAKAVMRELEQRGILFFHLAGHSMGGAVATLAAMRHPQRVRSLTLLAPGGFGTEINAPLLRAYGRAKTPAELRACLKVMFAPEATISGKLLEALVEQRAMPGQTEALGHIAASILAGEGQGVLDGAGLAGLATPVALVWGDQDRVMSCEQMKNAPAHFRRRLLAGAGHMLLDECPGAVTQAILETVARNVS